MRSYRINMNRLVNQLVPHYLGGRRIILFLQSCLQPLNSLNKQWKEWADERRLEAAMTSQVILLEHYLNRKFSKYFLDKEQRIFISEGSINGVPIYWDDNDTYDANLVLYHSSENPRVDVAFRYKNENQANSDVSFTICCPSINTSKISQAEITAMITYQVKKYCIAGKKFNITYE